MPTASVTDSARVIARILCLGFLGSLVSLQGGRTTLLPPGVPDHLVLVVQFALTCLFVSGVFVLVRPDRLARLSFVRAWPPHRLASIVCLALFLGILGVIVLQDRFYAQFDYDVDMPLLLLVAAPFVAFYLWNAAYSSARYGARRLFVVAVVAHATFVLISIDAFPLDPARSDMLPQVAGALEALANQRHPYVTIDEAIPLHYLPGLWLAFGPAWLLGIDLRITHVACAVATFTIVAVSVPSSRRYEALVLLAVFAQIPYLIFRHEVYVGVHWLTLALTLVFLARRQFMWGAASYGWSLSVVPFAGVMLPVFLIVTHRLGGHRVLWLTAVVAGAVASAFILPFWLTNPRAFLNGIIFFWRDRVALQSFNLSAPVLEFASLDVLLAIQVLAWVVLSGLALRRVSSVADGFRWMGWVCLAFVLLNRVVWSYFYPGILLLFLIGILGSESDRQTRLEPPSSW